MQAPSNPAQIGGGVQTPAIHNPPLPQSVPSGCAEQSQVPLLQLVAPHSALVQQLVRGIHVSWHGLNPPTQRQFPPSQLAPAPHEPQLPPQPSSPQTLPVQSAMQAGGGGGGAVEALFFFRFFLRRFFFLWLLFASAWMAPSSALPIPPKVRPARAPTMPRREFVADARRNKRSKKCSFMRFSFS
jgi:hypothetical protein